MKVGFERWMEKSRCLYAAESHAAACPWCGLRTFGHMVVHVCYALLQRYYARKQDIFGIRSEGKNDLAWLVTAKLRYPAPAGGRVRILRNIHGNHTAARG
jgi:hypothetical protein